MRTLEDHPEAGAAGGRLHFPGGRFQAAHNRFPSLWRDGLSLVGLAKRVYGPQYPSAAEANSRLPEAVDWIGGACLLLRRTAIDQVGAFDPAYHMYVEETDLCYRLWRQGWTVRFTPQADVVHHGGQSVGRRAAEQPRLYWSSVRTFYARHKAPWQGWVLGALIQLGYGARAVVWSLCGRLAADATRRNLWLARAEGARLVLQD